MHVAATYVPLIRGVEIASWDGSSKKKKRFEVGNALELLAGLNSDDYLWLMMGSTNASVALGAFRKGVVVRQLSTERLVSLVGKLELTKDPANPTGRRNISLDQVLTATDKPDLFYSMGTKQADALEISSAWQLVVDAMEQRKATANFLRARYYQEAIGSRTIQGQALPQDPKEAMRVLEEKINDLLGTKDSKGKKKLPSHQQMAFLYQQECQERSALERLCHKNPFYLHLFGDVEGVGPSIGARFVAALERIERFARPADVSNYAGMLPRGPEHKLPSRFTSRGQTLSRSPKLNAACFLLQDYMFQWGRGRTELGNMIEAQIQRECPCTQEQRDAAKELCKIYRQAVKESLEPPCSKEEYEQAKGLPGRYSSAVKRSRIQMTRYFLEKILYPRWRDYMGLAAA